MYATYLRLDVHVLDSDRVVIRRARSKLSAAARRDPARRDARKRFLRDMLAHHADARRLFVRSCF